MEEDLYYPFFHGHNAHVAIELLYSILIREIFQKLSLFNIQNTF